MTAPLDFRARWDQVESPSRSRFLIEHDLRANALRLSRGKTATHFSGSCARFLIEHDLFGKPLHTFPDHALVDRPAARLLQDLFMPAPSSKNSKRLDDDEKDDRDHADNDRCR